MALLMNINKVHQCVGVKGWCSAWGRGPHCCLNLITEAKGILSLQALLLHPISQEP